MVPTNIRTGGTFIIRGLVSSGSKINTIRLTVENGVGIPIEGYDRIVTVNDYMYDLKNLDSTFKFGHLGAGVYQYHIQSTDENGYTINEVKTFTVGNEKSSSLFVSVFGEK